MKKILVLLAIIIPLTGWTQTDTTIVKFTGSLNGSVTRGYSHAAIIDLGNCNMVYVSGQVAPDSAGRLVGKGNFGKQTEQVFMNLQHIVENSGGKMEHLVKLGIYLTDISNIQILRATRDRFINIKSPPASTLVEVSKLFRDDLLIEIEATAIIPKK